MSTYEFIAYPPPVTPPSTQQALLSDFSYILDSATRCATFTCGGSLPIVQHPSKDDSGNLTPRTEEKVQDQRVLTKGVTLRWGADGQGRTVSLPLQDESDKAAFQHLVNYCTPATFGRGGRDIYDETYRRAIALVATEFMTDFCPYEAGIIDIVTQLLLPPITGELKPQPWHSALAEKYNTTHNQEMEIRCAMESMNRKTAAEGYLYNTDIRNSSRDWGGDAGYSSPTRSAGSGWIEWEDLFAFAAGKIRAKDTKVVQRKEESKRMLRRGIRAELYKLNVYEGPSGLFKPHVDTPRSQHQIGGLVVCLPVDFEGGALSVRHQKEEVCYDWSTSGSKSEGPSVQWAAFYSYCEHEVFEVTAGHRVTLTYNLFLAPGTGLLAGKPKSLDATHLPIVNNLKTMLANDKFMPKGGYIGAHLTHRYPTTHQALHQFVPNMLKGVDMALYESIASLGLPMVLSPTSNADLPSAEAIEMLDNWGQDNDSHWPLKPKAGIRNLLQPVQLDEGEDRGPNDEEEAKEQLLTYAEASDNDEVHSDIDVESFQASNDEKEKLMAWKERILGRRKIHWLNGFKHLELSRAFMAYGNEAEMKWQYSSAAIVAKIPKLSLRKGTRDEPMQED